MSAGIDTLAQEQADLLAALWGVADGREGYFEPQGLEAYRRNAGAIAERALGAAYPSLRQCFDKGSFAGLAHDFWHDRPPRCGDLARWGEALPGWLADQAAAHDLPPWMGPLAQGEWQLHAMAALADQEPAGDTLARLVEGDPDRLRLQLAPGTSVMRADLPLVSLLHACGSGLAAAEVPAASDRADDEGRVGQLIELGAPEIALFWRQGWRPRVRALAPDEALWIEALLAAPTLGAAVARAGPVLERMDLTAWLGQALESRLLLAVRDA
ncbi:MAG: putative DNA-binding domain-containing protein [Curvibacter sp.]|nr:putative DNA-binding domain-containing protein [Curvibacter sp.]